MFSQKLANARSEQTKLRNQLEEECLVTTKLKDSLLKQEQRMEQQFKQEIQMFCFNYEKDFESKHKPYRQLKKLTAV